MRKVLYLGLNPPSELDGQCVIHYPVIDVVPMPISKAFEDLPRYTHFIFTSKTAVDLFLEAIDVGMLRNKVLIAVGKATAASLDRHGLHVDHVAEKEQAEGVVEILETLDLSGAYLFWPHSSRARPLIADYLRGRGVSFRETALYKTVTKKPLPVPSLEDIDEIVFTSPSTVEGFVDIFGALPTDKALTPIGPITEEAMIALKESSHWVYR